MLLGKSISELTYQSGMYVADTGAYVMLSGGITVSCGGMSAEGDALEAAEAFVSALDGKVSTHELLERNDAAGLFVFGQYIDSLEVEGARLTVRVSGGRLSADGTYIYAPVLPSAGKSYSEPLDVLLKFLSQDTQSREVKDLSLCFIAEKKISGSGLRPAYRITDENGYNYFFDAETGERIK